MLWLLYIGRFVVYRVRQYSLLIFTNIGSVHKTKNNLTYRMGQKLSSWSSKLLFISSPNTVKFYRFYYRAMHFSAKRCIAIACRLSVCLFVCPSVTLVDCDHIGWNSSKIISPLLSLGCSLFETPT